MKMELSDFKKAVVSYLDTEIVPKAHPDKKILYVGLGILAPKMIDKYVLQYAEILEVAEVIDDNYVVDIEEAESFFSQVLAKTDGYQMVGIKFTADDIHTIANIARRM